LGIGFSVKRESSCGVAPVRVVVARANAVELPLAPQDIHKHVVCVEHRIHRRECPAHGPACPRGGMDKVVQVLNVEPSAVVVVRLQRLNHFRKVRPSTHPGTGGARDTGVLGRISRRESRKCAVLQTPAIRRKLAVTVTREQRRVGQVARVLGPVPVVQVDKVGRGRGVFEFRFDGAQVLSVPRPELRPAMDTAGKVDRVHFRVRAPNAVALQYVDGRCESLPLCVRDLTKLLPGDDCLAILVWIWRWISRRRARCWSWRWVSRRWSSGWVSRRRQLAWCFSRVLRRWSSGWISRRRQLAWCFSRVLRRWSSGWISRRDSG
jgi:hypothetical protein